MTYELVKQLKDAGFPHNPNALRWQDGDVSIPTLSELIEACGRPFWLETYPEEWRCGNARGMDFPSFAASTPEEAVAKLWLALNQK